MTDRTALKISRRYMKTSEAYGPAGNAPGEPGHEAKKQSIFWAVTQGIDDGNDAREWMDACDIRGYTARKVVKALEDAGFRIIRAPSNRRRTE